MSDFDEEAERERLREQFEQDRKKREATEQMSELLLQGATMTDAHCETCGDPIFRYEGQEFCPTCQGSAGGSADDATAAADGTAAGDEPSANAPAEASSAPPAESRSGTTAEPSEPAGESPAGAATADAADGTQAAGPAEKSSAGTQRDRHVDVPALDPGQQQPTARDAGDLEDARDSLVATLSSFARQAEATDDPRRARDALEAAREAAETLAALDRRR